MNSARSYPQACAIADRLSQRDMALLAHFLVGYDPVTFLHIADYYQRQHPDTQQVEAAHAEALAEDATRAAGVPGENGDTWCYGTRKNLAEQGLKEPGLTEAEVAGC